MFTFRLSSTSKASYIYGPNESVSRGIVFDPLGEEPRIQFARDRLWSDEALISLLKEFKVWRTDKLYLRVKCIN